MDSPSIHQESSDIPVSRLKSPMEFFGNDAKEITFETREDLGPIVLQDLGIIDPPQNPILDGPSDET